MKALLMHPDRDFDPELKIPHWPTYRARVEDPRADLLPFERALIEDLGVDLLISAMANGDEFLSRIADKALREAWNNEIETIAHRQDILREGLSNPTVLKEIYAIAVDAIETSRKRWWDISSRYVSSVMQSSVGLLTDLFKMLRKLRQLADEYADEFSSTGLASLFEMLQRELNDQYLEQVDILLSELKFRRGVLLNAALGEWSESTNYVLHDSTKEPNWLDRLLGAGPPQYTYRLPPRDEPGARILSGMRARAISRVAVVVAESADHVLSFFKALRTELAFYVGCINLRDRLSNNQNAICIPCASQQGERVCNFRGLYDVSLALQTRVPVTSNDLEANDRDLVVITGANQGGKSVFLRSLGLAQLMMQAGMFVAADDFHAETCAGLFAHYKREEDVAMESGKLDEELARMSEIVDHIRPNSLLLSNESFAATNEREGSEIARQIVSALLEKGVKVVMVTHLYDFARSMFDAQNARHLFLRAQRGDDGARTFKILPGEPLQTSFGEDLYEQIFKLTPPG